MRFFKEEDGLVERVAKLTTIGGVIFGGWAYFHTIHPVFEKEMELQNLRGEAQVLTSQIDELNASMISLKQDKSSLLSSLELLQVQQEKLVEAVANKESQLRDLSTSFENASDAAVLNKLQYYSNKLQSEHLLAVATGEGDSFDVLSFSRELLATHVPDEEDAYAQKAYEYFERYVQDHSGEVIRGDETIRFAVSLFFNYKIDLLRERIAATR